MYGTPVTGSLAQLGGTAPAAGGAPAGHGLIGIRQRALAFGGTITAGPAPGGGWRMRAELPADPQRDGITG
ncbi:MAG: hypothetical protein ABSA53_31585 [Streptosporangiaceae bacterium]|jgi:hypothetical protein